MPNPIHGYWAQDQEDEAVPQVIHASDGDDERTLCGRLSGHRSGRRPGEHFSWRPLRDVGGTVSCKTCTKVLKARNIYDSYIGPTAFFKAESYVKDEVVLNDFGWSAPDVSFSHFFAYGHLRPGRLLEIARELVANDLIGLEEHRTTVYEHWGEYRYDDDDARSCIKRFMLTPEIDDSDLYTNQQIARPIEVTVLRHVEWALIAIMPGVECRESEYRVRYLCDWYRGARQLGRPATPRDVERDYLPGFTVIGIPAGETENICLEWPTADFEESLRAITHHEKLGATDLGISGCGFSVSIEQLRNGTAAHVRRSIREYGPGLSFQGYLEG